ncbi:MAG: hypothetical protein U9O49_00990 [Candidatus Thermoplasmatota archaeon]|nr:hypothetical protein [Candidatus Thermoplasmatota archaeon]
MTNKYGIYQSTSKSCVFYKQDKNGNQSTFNIFVTPELDEKKPVLAFIDNDQIGKENWAFSKESGIKDVLEAFGGWASDAPVVFEMEAHRSMGQCLSSVLKKEETD